jgi:hypothetical protein
MKRKRPSKRQIVGHWEASGGKCWRCEQKIINEIYGVGWQLGHCDKPHWMGGVAVAPEHTACNQADGVMQTKAAAKSVRIRARNIGIKKSPGTFARLRAWRDRILAERATKEPTP